MPARLGFQGAVVGILTALLVTGCDAGPPLPPVAPLPSASGTPTTQPSPEPASTAAPSRDTTPAPTPVATRKPPALDLGAAEPSDFNGDGFADIAIGIPGAAIAGRPDVGAVQVLDGSRSGIRSPGANLWTQDDPGVPGRARTGTRFGETLASGDFNADGYADLAIGAPAGYVDNDTTHPGSVIVLYGSPPGLRSSNSQEWTRSGLLGAPEGADSFGRALAAGDFDGDGYWDLAVGPAPVTIGDPGAGQLIALRGGPEGLSGERPTLLPAAAMLLPGEAGNQHLGTSLTVGDLNGDGYADLAASMTTVVSGAIVFYGDPAGLAPERVQHITAASANVEQEITGFTAGTMAAGDLDADGVDDLALGTPAGSGEFEKPPSVVVLRGTPGGLTAEDRLLIDGARDQDGCGSADALAIGDVDGDGTADLAVGSAMKGGGSVCLLFGSSAGFASMTRRMVLSQDTPGTPGTSEPGDLFGATLLIADFDNSGSADLAVGAPGEIVGDPSRTHTSGRVTIIFGDAPGTAPRPTSWDLGARGMGGTGGPESRFGGALPGSQQRAFGN